LVLVSIDGFRWDYLDRPEARQMKALADRGARVTKLRPVYPSKTFPAHLSIATGLHPTGHGIVDNYFCRNDRPDCYSMGAAREDPSWLSGTPLWTLVEEQGGRAATFFWPESDAVVAGTLPSDYRKYDGRTPHAERVSQVLEWLEVPEAERPHLVTLYFSTVDSAGHAHGPNAPQTRVAIAEIDHWIAALWDAIEQINRREAGDINLMLVSDHGMAAVDRTQFIDTDRLPRPRGFKRVTGATRVMYYQRDPDADIAALSRRLEEMSEGRYRVVSNEELVSRHYQDHPAVASLIIETAPPRVFRRGGAEGADLLGMHGYPASDENMAAFLVAIGPSFSAQMVISEAHQLDIYPVVAQMLNLIVPATVVSDGGALRGVLLSAERK
jgi:predicted AlkP superfamily pyrophosphatase or phosphodiesterase